MHGLASSANGAPQCAFRMMGNPTFPPRHPPRSETGSKPFPITDILPIQRPFLRAARVLLQKGHHGCFFNGYGLFYCEAAGKGEPVVQRIREKTVPISKRVITRFQRRAKCHLFAAAHDGLHNGTQAVTKTGRPQRFAHLPKDDKRPVPKQGPSPLPKSDMTHFQARFEIWPERAGQTCICPSLKRRTATIWPIPSNTGCLLPDSKWAFCPANQLGLARQLGL
jgi:hypothetical protein